MDVCGIKRVNMAIFRGCSTKNAFGRNLGRKYYYIWHITLKYCIILRQKSFYAHKKHLNQEKIFPFKVTRLSACSNLTPVQLLQPFFFLVISLTKF